MYSLSLPPCERDTQGHPTLKYTRCTLRQKEIGRIALSKTSGMKNSSEKTTAFILKGLQQPLPIPPFQLPYEFHNVTSKANRSSYNLLNRLTPGEGVLQEIFTVPPLSVHTVLEDERVPESLPSSVHRASDKACSTPCTRGDASKKAPNDPHTLPIA